MLSRKYSPLPALLLAGWVGSASAQSIRLALEEAAATQITNVKVCKETVPATVSFVDPKPDKLVVIATDTMTPAEIAALRVDLLAQVQAMPKSATFQLGIWSEKSFSINDVITNAAQLTAALKELTAPTETAPSAESPLEFYSGLAKIFSGPEMLPFSTLVIAHFPKMDRELEEYALTYLTNALMSKKLQVAFREAGFEGTETPPGTLPHRVALFTQVDGHMAEISWKSPAYARGFALCEGDAAGTPFPAAQIAPSFALPDIAHYAKLLAAKAMKDKITPEALTEALAINPGDRDLLRMAVEFSKGKRDSKAAAEYLATLAEIDPNDGKLQLELGSQVFASGDFDRAEKIFVRGRELQASSAESSQQLALIYINRKNAAAAFPLLDESLAQDPKNQSVWFLRASLAAGVNDWQRQADSEEKGIALGGDVLNHRTTLIQLYLDHNLQQKAGAQVDISLAMLPQDPELRSKFAGFMERLNRPDDAISLWTQVLKLDPKREPAHYALGRLLAAKGALDQALQAADAGLAVFPQSARLNLLKVTVLERQGRIYQARQLLLAAAATLDDVPVLEHAAEVEDRSGAPATALYTKLIEKMVAAGSAREAIVQAADRGRFVSIREGDPGKSIWFEQQLFSQGVKLPSPVHEYRPESSTISLPGGRDALAYVARGRPGSSPEHFLADYCRAILNVTDSATPAVLKAYQESVRDYFAKLTLLLQLQDPDAKPEKATVTLSVTDPAARRRADQVLLLFGWKLRTADQKIVVDSGASQARKQELAAALGVDPARMQEAFQTGKPFPIQIPTDQVALFLPKLDWISGFTARVKLTGGLPEAFAMDPNLARAYAGLSGIDMGTAQILTGAIGVKPLVDRYASVINRYGPALSVSGSSIVVPGGKPAEVAWTQVVGATPADPPQFMRAILDKDGGLGMQYFAAISQLDSRHQDFFVRGAARIPRFYEASRDTVDTAKGKTQITADLSFLDFIRAVPLKGDGSVDFPGGAEAWLPPGAKAAEDEIILRLARARFRPAGQPFSEAERFAAIVRIDQRRKEDRQPPLDSTAAAFLIQNYAQFSGLYPYFSTFTLLSASDFQKIFGAAQRLNGLNPNDLNPVLGQFESALELLSLSLQAGKIAPNRAAELLAGYCDGFLKAASAADYSNVSIAFLRNFATGAPNSGSVDAALRDMILGNLDDVQLQSGGTAKTFQPGKLRAAEFDKVLDAQKVPSVKQIVESTGAAPLPDLAQQVRLAMSGLVYAYYFRSTDRPISEDPQLLRKHQFIAPRPFAPSEFQAGAFAGGFAYFSEMLGQTAISGALKADPNTGSIAALQVGSLRNTSWASLRDAGQQYAALRIRIAREWCVHASFETTLLDDLSADTLGLISIARRRDLLNGIGSRNWAAVWSSLTLADLYELGGRYSARYSTNPWDSPVSIALRECTAKTPGGKLEVLGSDRRYLTGAGATDLTELAPYEELERQPPTKMAERVAEFKLYLAEYFDRAGLPAQGLSLVAEKAALKLLGDVHLADPRDWSSVLAAYSRLDAALIEAVLPK